MEEFYDVFSSSVTLISSTFNVVILVFVLVQINIPKLITEIISKTLLRPANIPQEK